MMKETYLEMMETLQRMAGLAKIIENNLRLGNTGFEYDKAENLLNEYLTDLNIHYPFGADNEMDNNMIDLNGSIELVNLNGHEGLLMDDCSLVCPDSWSEVRKNICHCYTSMAMKY